MILKMKVVRRQPMKKLKKVRYLLPVLVVSKIKFSLFLFCISSLFGQQSFAQVTELEEVAEKAVTEKAVPEKEG